MRTFGGRHKCRHPALSAALLQFLLAFILFYCPGALAAVPSPVAPPVASEVIVMLELDGAPLVDGFVASQRGETISLPLCALAELLSLSIACSDHRAYGFLIRQDHPFVIDLGEGYVISERQAFRVEDGAFAAGGDILVTLQQLSKWLPITFSYDKGSSIVKIRPREPLPLQMLKKRQERDLQRPLLAAAKPYPELTPPRALVSLPTVDLTTLATFARGGHSAATVVSNALDLSGDFLLMSGQGHLYAVNDELKRVDLTLLRRGEGMVGFLPVTLVAVGSTQSTYIDGVGGTGKPHYGFFVSNRPLNASMKFLTHDVNGYLPAGWDAELFHNGVQVGYQPPTQDGMYHFQNLRVLYGVNQFKIVMHGPFGELRETEEIIVSDALTSPGAVLYSFSAGWETSLTRGDASWADSDSNLTLTADFGVADRLTGSAMAVRLVDKEGFEHDFAGLGARTALGYTLLSLEVIGAFSPRDGKTGQLWTLKSSSRDLFGFNVEAGQRFFNDYASPQFPQESDPVVSSTAIRANSSALIGEIAIPYSIELEIDPRRSSQVDTKSRWRVSGGWNGWNGSLEAELSRVQRVLCSSALLQVSTRHRGIGIRGQVGATFAPDLLASTINLSADLEISRGLLLNSTLLHDPATNVSGLKVGVTKRTGVVGYTVTATGSSNGVYALDIGVTASSAWDAADRQAVISAEPLSPFGMVAVSASVTENGNSRRVLHEAGFLVNGARAATITGTDGTPVIVNLQPDVPVDIMLDMTTIEDPFMVPEEEGCHIVPRAGVVASCSFAMTTGGEIDGMVFVGSRGIDLPVKGVRVDLLEGSGNNMVTSTRSQESGYYLFKGVKPGRYNIAIPHEESRRLQAGGVAPIAVVMPAGGDMISGKDFMLRRDGVSR